MTTITLPIKCSTIKKVNNILTYVLWILVVMGTLVFLGACAFISEPVDPEYFVGGIWFLSMSFVIFVVCTMACAFMLIISFANFVCSFPTLECIKDEDEKP